jgi:RNA polymerase sigma-70 factor (ECF subfamily)
MDRLTDNDLFQELKNNNEVAFEQLFHKYYASLCLFTSQFLHDREKAEEIVQEVFVKIWSKREKLEINTSVRNYLLFSVRNRCLNLLQHEKVEKRYSRQAQVGSPYEQDLTPYFMEVGLRQKIEESIGLLPEKRREIFRLSREKGLRYHEIADRLSISVKTVETQMGLALKQLREMLKDYNDYL